MEQNVEGMSVSPNDSKPDVSRRLSEGDKLYRVSYSEITHVIVIARTTKTQALSEDGRYKFRVELSSYGTASKMGDTDRWSSATFYIETEELREKLYRQNTVKKLKDFNYKELSTEKLKQVWSLLNGG